MSIPPSKNATTSHILGIDYGRAKIGVAIADSETRIASGYAVLDNDKNFLSKLVGIIAKEEISKVIIGAQEIRGLTSSALEVRPRIKSDAEKMGNLLKEKLTKDLHDIRK